MVNRANTSNGAMLLCMFRLLLLLFLFSCFSFFQCVFPVNYGKYLKLDKRREKNNATIAPANGCAWFRCVMEEKVTK